MRFLDAGSRYRCLRIDVLSKVGDLRKMYKYWCSATGPKLDESFIYTRQRSGQGRYGPVAEELWVKYPSMQSAET